MAVASASCWLSKRKAVEMAARYKIIIVLKGHYTLTIWPNGEILVNSSGTEALATAGSGDVLTGLVTGLAAQNMAPEISEMSEHRPGARGGRWP